MSIAALCGVALGTSCGERRWAFHRFELSRQPATAFALPMTVEVEGLRFELPRPKRHWWSDDPPRPECEGFAVYTLTRLARGESRDSIPLDQFEVRLSYEPAASLELWYSYFVPLRWLAEGGEGAARIAEWERAFTHGAEELVRELLEGSRMEPTLPAVRTDRFEHWDDFERRCRGTASRSARAPGTQVPRFAAPT